MTLSEEQLAFVLQEGMVPQQQVNTGVIGEDEEAVVLKWLLFYIVEVLIYYNR